MNALNYGRKCMSAENGARHSELKKIKKQMPQSGEITQLADFFSVLSDGTRVLIVSALRHGELCVSHLAELLGLSDSAVSHQLRLMRQNNIVKSRREGKYIYYSLSDEHVIDIYDVVKTHIDESRALKRA